MLDRRRLKEQARGLMIAGRPSPLGVGGVYVLLGTLLSTLSARLVGLSMETLERVLGYMNAGDYERAAAVLTAAKPPLSSWLIDLALELTMLIIGVGFIIFVLNTVRGTGPAFGNLLDGFAFPLRVILLNLVIGILVILWSLLFVIPGIIAAYRYSMAVFVMIDNPDFGVMDCIRESKRITDGHKGELFKLDLSFLPLYLLAIFLPYFGTLVSIFLTPYVALTRALYYERLSGRVTDAYGY